MSFDCSRRPSSPWRECFFPHRELCLPSLIPLCDRLESIMRDIGFDPVKERTIAWHVRLNVQDVTPRPSTIHHPILFPPRLSEEWLVQHASRAADVFPMPWSSHFARSLLLCMDDPAQRLALG